MLLEHYDLDSSASHQETEDHSGGSTACDAATRLHGFNFGLRYQFLLRHRLTPLLRLRELVETNSGLVNVAVGPGPKLAGLVVSTLRKLSEGRDPLVVVRGPARSTAWADYRD